MFSIAAIIQPNMNNLLWAIENNYVASLPIGCENQTNLSFPLLFDTLLKYKSSMIFEVDNIQNQ